MNIKQTAHDEILRLSNSATWQRESVICALGNLDTWAEYVEDALRTGDIDGAKACVAVIRRLLAR